MLCPVCRKNKALYDEYYGYLPCATCFKTQSSLPKPQTQVEFVGEDIKNQRKAFSQDIRPAHRKGKLDRGFIDKYGAEKAKRQGFTEEEIKNSTYVWDGDDTNSYYKKGN